MLRSTPQTDHAVLHIMYCYCVLLITLDRRVTVRGGLPLPNLPLNATGYDIGLEDTTVGV